MASYDGPVEVWHSGLKIAEVEVHLEDEPGQRIVAKGFGEGGGTILEGIGQWNGHITDGLVDDFELVGETIQLKHPDGRTADALILGLAIKGSGNIDFLE